MTMNIYHRNHIRCKWEFVHEYNVQIPVRHFEYNYFTIKMIYKIPVGEKGQSCKKQKQFKFFKSIFIIIITCVCNQGFCYKIIMQCLAMKVESNISSKYISIYINSVIEGI